MGSYATVSELKTRFADDEEVAFLTDSEASGSPDSDVLDDCLESAESDINCRIGKLYKTGAGLVALLTGTGGSESIAMLRRKTLDIAEYYLLLRNPSQAEQKKEQYLRALELFDKIGDGTFVLSGAITPPSTVGRDPLAYWSGSDRDLTDVDTRLISRETASGL